MPLFYERWAIADTKGETNRCICFVLDRRIWNLLAPDRGANVFLRTEKEEVGEGGALIGKVDFACFGFQEQNRFLRQHTSGMKAGSRRRGRMVQEGGGGS